MFQLRQWIAGILATVLGAQSQVLLAKSNSSCEPAGLTSTNSIPGGVVVLPHRMRGKDYPWEHEIQIALPSYYGNTRKSYPVLWVTDGQSAFLPVAEMINGELRRRLPEMIVVGVGTPCDELKELQSRRVYDFTPATERGFRGPGGKLFEDQMRMLDSKMKAAGMPLADRRGGSRAFLSFLVDELRPALSQQYRMSDDATLYGHSAGGLFCTYALLARPEAFKRYLCTSPNLNTGNYALFRMEERYAETHKDLPAEVFFAAGEGEILEGGWISGWGIVSSMTRMAEILRLRSYPSLQLHVRILPGEEHAASSASLRWGLRTLWAQDPELFE